MMKYKNDFEKIGKTVPYKVPDDFFCTITEKTLSRAKERLRKAKMRSLVIWTSVAASVLIIAAFAGLNLNPFGQSHQPETIVQAKENLSIKIQEKEIALIPETIMENNWFKIENEPEPAFLETYDLQGETLENLLVQLSDEELLVLAGQLSAELYFNELIDD